MNLEKYKEVCETIINSIDNVIKQYIDKPSRLRSYINRDYNWKAEKQYIAYGTEIRLIDENDKSIFGAEIELKLNEGLLEVSTGTMGNFSKENYGQYNKYIIMGEILKNINEIENQINSIIEQYKDEFNTLEDQLRDERRQKEKEEREAREQEHKINLENAEKECREIAEQKNLKVNHKKLITVITQYGGQTRYNNWFEALDYVKRF